MKHVVFDFDGTIADSKEQFMMVFNETSQRYKLRGLMMEEYDSLSTLKLLEIFKKFGVPWYKIPIMIFRMPRMIKDAQMEFRKHIDSVSLITGIKDILLELKSAGVKLSIVSTNSVENIEDFVNNNSIDVFDHIISIPSLYGKHKAIKRFMDSTGIGENDILYIGDEIRDIKSCKRIRVKIAAVTWGYNSKDTLVEWTPDFIVNKPSELSKLVYTFIDK